MLRDKSDYIQEFNRIKTKSKVADRIGKKQGFFIAGFCVGNRDLKMRPINNFLKEHKGCEQVVGIAIDEPKRLERMHNKENRISVLEQYGIKEAQTYEICKKYNLLSPIYAKNSRGGCWFCPNSKIKEMADLKQNHIELWHELERLNQVKDKVSIYFMRNKTFEQVNAEVDAYIKRQQMQIKLPIGE